MKLLKRMFEQGDDVNINKLYKFITGRDRSIDEYRWEWIDTWMGIGSIWLVFDNDRDFADQLIMQYSLIPTPFSLWGKSYLAGKTENCMCHPDFRGKGQFFNHEKESFEEAKRKYQLFFTTDGTVTKGAVGAVRRKLGYVALDKWTQYLFFLNNSYLQKFFIEKLNERKYIPSSLMKFIAVIFSNIIAIFFKFIFPRKISADIRIFNKDKAPLHEIENLWNRNKVFYLISVDRQLNYLDWRINKNPYNDYKYMLYYKDNILVGYVIYSLTNNNICVIEDILVENKDVLEFDTLISNIMHHAKEIGASAISCPTLANNSLLNIVFTKNKFINTEKLKKIFSRKESPKGFHVYVSSDIEYNKQDPLNPQNWYITSLVKEGLKL